VVKHNALKNYPAYKEQVKKRAQRSISSISAPNNPRFYYSSYQQAIKQKIPRQKPLFIWLSYCVGFFDYCYRGWERNMQGQEEV